MRKLLAALIALIPGVAWGQYSLTANNNHSTQCGFEFAVSEMVGPPSVDTLRVSVVPYDAAATGQKLRVCAVPDASRDQIIPNFQTASGAVTCSATSSGWAAEAMVTMALSGL